jgi:FkbH-like protein
MSELFWLPQVPQWHQSCHAAAGAGQTSWAELVALANARIDFVQTNRLDRLLARSFGNQPPPELPTRPVRLAVFGSSTVDHLLPGLKVGALRHNMWLKAYTPAYAQYLAELTDDTSALHKFKPDVVLCAFDTQHAIAGASPDLGTEAADAIVQHALHRLRALWRLTRERLRASVIQQTFLVLSQPLIGNNEHRLPGSAHRLTALLNARLRETADEEGVDILALDEQSANDGISSWHDPVLWLQAKQYVSVSAGPHYGELVARLIAARQGASRKCLVLDLDNTLWGGTMGDDGPEGIVLGPGSAQGEAYVDFQRYVSVLARRGVIVAICSKNDEAAALALFDSHPEMILKREEVACFSVNWNDKAGNLRDIARRLNIGVDTLVFVDDSAFERNLIRRELPMVAVPELPDDPAHYPACIARGGYFEAVSITREDAARTQFYQSNFAREAALAAVTDMNGYLRSLSMELRWSPFDRMSLQRVVQLINKTNQFNLTTRRYTEDDVISIMGDERSLTLQLRLLDEFGDNGIIAVVVGLPMEGGRTMRLDTWLMSCRVLGRKVEEATLNVLASEAIRLGAATLIGEYRPTPRNVIVRDHYQKLGFRALADSDMSRWELPLPDFRPFDVPMKSVRV